MKALHARIRTLRGKAGLKAMNLLIVKPAAVPNENK